MAKGDIVRRVPAILLSAAILLAGCGREPAAGDEAVINIAFQSWVGYGLFYLASEKGFDKEEGFRLNIVDEELDSARQEAFKMNMLDCEAATLDLLIEKASQGMSLAAVMKIDESAGSDSPRPPGAHVPASTKEYPGIIIDTLNVRQDLIDGRPDLVKKLMRCWFRALSYYRENPAEASQIISKYYGISPEEYRRQAEGLRWISYAGQSSGGNGNGFIETAGIIIDAKIISGRIKERPDTQLLVDFKLLENLYEDSK